MGKTDTESINYMNDNAHFADAFNYLIYGGEQIISPESLRSLDTRETGIPHSNSGRVPLQRYRDTIKLWEAKTDGETIFVLLGGEIQDKVHYAMPVRDDLYDFLNYANQVEVKRKHYRDQMKNADD